MQQTSATEAQLSEQKHTGSKCKWTHQLPTS